MSQTVSIKLTVDGASQAAAQTQQLTDAVKKLGSESVAASRSTASIGSSFKDLTHLAGSLSMAAMGAREVAKAVIAIPTALVEAQVQADRLKQSLGTTFGSASVKKEIGYIAEVSDRLGLSLRDTALSYAKLAAANKGTSLEGEGTRRVFESIGNAAAKMGLSAAEADGALTAIQQMISKGTVSAEELRGQLGERLPGAFQIAARAMGVTTAELGKMLEQGQIVASDFLPKFAEEMNKTFGAGSPIETAQASLNRLSTSWEQFKNSIAETGAANPVIALLDDFAERLGKAARAMEEARKQGLGGFGQAAVGAFAGTFNVGVGLEDQKKQALKDIDDLTQALDKYLAKKDKSKGYLSPLDRDAVATIERQISEAKTKLAALAKEGEFKLPNLAEQWKKNQEADKQALAEYIKTRRSAAKKMADEIKEENAAYNALRIKDAEAEEAHRNRLLEIQNKYGKEAAKAAKEKARDFEEALRAAASFAEEMERTAEASANQVKTLKEEAVQIAGGAAGLAQYKAANLEAAAAIEEFNASIYASAAAHARSNGAAEEAIRIYDRLAEAAHEAAMAKREQARLTVDNQQAKQAKEDFEATQKAAAAAAKKSAEDSAREWENFSRDIERSLTDALMRSFESGENAGEAFVKSLKNTIKAAVLKMAVQVVMQPVMGGLQSMLGGGGGAGGQVGGAGVSISDITSLANMSATPFTAGLNRLTDTGIFGSSLMERLPSGAYVPTELGSSMTSTASFLDSYGGYIGAALQLAQGDARGAAFTAAGSYIGSLTPVGPIIGSIIGSILGGLFGGSGERFATMTGQSSGTYDDGRFTSGTMNRDWGSYAGAANFGTDIEAALNRTVQAYTGCIGSLFDAFGLEDTISARADTRLRRTSGSVASNFHVDLDGVNGPLGEIRPISADYGEDGEVQQALADFVNDIMTDGIKAAVAASTLPELVKDLFEPLTESKEIEEALATVINAQKYLIKEGTTLSAFLGANAQEFMVGEENLVGALNRVITSLSVINPILEDINQSAYAMTMAGGDAASQLAALSGGVEAFASKANAYYQEYFTDDERLAKLQAKVESTFEELDIEMPDTKAEFRAIVESLDLTTAAGRGTFAALMDLSPAFAEIANAAGSATETVSEAVSQILQRLQQDRAALEADLLEAQGNPNAANAARRAIAIQGMSAAEIAAWDYNEALRAQIAGYQAATEAAAQAQAAQDELERSRLDWTQKIAVLKGETTQQEIERINLINSTTDDYTQSLINAYYALLDVNAATEEAARLAEEEAQKTRQANDLRADLTRQMNDLGRTGLGNALHDIALRAAAYRKELEELGRATDANLAVVANWQAAMQRNILANDSLQRMQAISGRMDAVAGVRGSLQDSLFTIQSQRAGFNAVDYWTEQVREAGQGLIGGPLEDRLAAAQSVRDALMHRYNARLEVINKSLSDGIAAIEANARAAEAAARKQFALEEDARRTAIAQANTLNAAYRAVGAYAKSLLQSELSPLSGKAQLTYNRREYNRMLTASRTGDLSALGGLSAAAGSYLESARAQSITAVDYARTFARTRNELTRLGNKAGTDIEFVAREFYFASQEYDRQKLELQRSTDASIALLQTITADRLTHLVERTDTWTANLEEQLRDEAVVYATLTQGVIDSRDALRNVDANVREAVIDARAARATWNAMWARIQDDNGTLVQEVRALRADLTAQNSTIARNTATTARLLDSVTDGGNNMLTVAA